MYNIPLNIKYIFISFMQALFKTVGPYRWNPDPKISKILILDKYTQDLSVAKSRPSIIISRGTIGWTFTNRGQDGINAGILSGMSSLYGYESTPDPTSKKAFVDLLAGSIDIQVIHKNGVEAEEIANFIFTNLTGFKDELRQAGIYKISSLTMGPEQLIQSTSEPILHGLTVSISFQSQQPIIKSNALYYLQILLDTVEIYEDFDYTVISNGTQIRFKEIPSVTPKATYTDGVTLQVQSNVSLTATADPLIWELPIGSTIRGRYNILSAINITNDESNQH